jgi:hypothetical protein
MLRFVYSRIYILVFIVVISEKGKGLRCSKLTGAVRNGALG